MIKKKETSMVRTSNSNMAANALRCLLGVLVAVFTIGVERTEALTIYRIGGDDLPAPESASEQGVEFVQLTWADVDDDLFGASDQLELTSTLIPVRLDPTVNLTPLIRERGGRIQLNNGYGWQDQPTLDFLFDGDYDTTFQGFGGDQSGSQFLKGFWIDFAGLFPIRRVVFQPSPRFFNERFVKTYIVGTNDGDIRKLGTREHRYYWREGFIDFDVVHNVTENTASLLDLALPDAPIAEMMVEIPSGNWEIAELEIYGDGFASQAIYTSNIIDLGDRSSLGNLRWSGSTDEGADVSLIMRTGDDPDPNHYWRLTFRGDERSRFDASGAELTRRAYSRLEGGEKAGVSPDNASWQFWTPPLDFARQAAPLAGSKPRRFVQFRADFLSSRAQAGGRLDYLEFEVSQPPVASHVLAEIVPTRAEFGVVTPFTLKLQPLLSEQDLGFDSIEITAPIAPESVDAVRIGSRSLNSDEYEVGDYTGESFVVKIPRIGLQESGELIEVVFRNEVFRVGTVFSGRVFDSELPNEVRQRVTAGDADLFVDSNTLSVRPTEVSSTAIRTLHVSAFTPNGDGVNDLLRVEYDLVNLDGAVPVTLEVYNLAGRRMAEVSTGSAASGRFAADWNGSDANDATLPPGLYLLRLVVESDKGNEIAVAAVPIVY